MTDYQVAIIGGGPAGLSAALTLSRSMMRTIIFDSPLPPRNDAARHVGGFPGMDMASPTQVRERIAEEIKGYGYAQIKSAEISSAKPDGNGFSLSTQGGSRFHAERLLLTTGMVDIFPPIAGLNRLWGTSVINCPFCQGYEFEGRPWGVYVHRPEILAAAEVYRNWTRDIVLFVDPRIEVPAERAREIEALDIRIVNGSIEALQSSQGALSQVVLRDGKKVDREVLLVWPRQKQCDLVESLDLPLREGGYVEIDECYRTGRKGIYAAGDLTYGGHQNANTAIHMGNMAAAWLVFDLCQTQVPEPA